MTTRAPILMPPEPIRLLRAHGINPFETPFDANVVVIRGIGKANEFDGLISISWRRAPGGMWDSVQAPAATRPGTKYLENPMNAYGTAAYACGFRNARSHAIIGTHKGRPAFPQRASVHCVRDNDRDSVWDPTEKLLTDGSGMNVHDCDDPAWLAGCIGTLSTDQPMLIEAFKYLQTKFKQDFFSLAVVRGPGYTGP